jgi:DNA-binding transcriptional LysR family regulator
MERQDIEVFLALGDELHIGRTAERLRLAPAVISRAVLTLERQVGGPLIVRSAGRVELTPRGRQLHDDLRPAWALVRQAFDRATAGDLRLGYVGAAVAPAVRKLTSSFRHPVSLRETARADRCGPLRRAEVDLAVLPLPVAEPDLTVGPVLLSEPAGYALVWRTDNLSPLASAFLSHTASALPLSSGGVPSADVPR